MFDHRTAPKPTGPTAQSSPSAAASGVAHTAQLSAGNPSVASRLCAGSFEALFAQLTELVTALAECSVPADSSALVGVRAQIDRLTAVVTEAEIRFDQAELWRDEGAGSLRGWMADHCGLGRRGAPAAARRVERLELWPAVAEAWSAGQLSAAQVDVIVGAVPRRFVSLFADHAESVVEIVGGLDVAKTEVAIRQWVECASNPDGPEHFHEPTSGLHFDRVLDGRFILTGQFEAADAAIIDAALRDFDVPDPVDDSGQPIGESRTLAQRNADALVEICRFALSHRQGAGDSGRHLPHVSLVVDINELRASALRGAGVHSHAGLEQLAEARGWSAAERAWFTDSLHRHGTGVTFDGTELDAAAVSLLTCDSVVQRVMMAGDKVLDMGRETRTATSVQRRAIITRDRHCRAPGCCTKPKHCDVHHIDHWINGGRTDVDRMVLLCGTHHRQFHRPGYRMELDENAVFTVHSPKGWSRSTTPDRIETPYFTRTSG
ncbi:unannotated protein [freshwater metagenome]|uniref:Unannotated protein n=1 Tax=freshwater metagenome TaxID=449393 RepID=A0A6J5YJB8_9ZZZZ